MHIDKEHIELYKKGFFVLYSQNLEKEGIFRISELKGIIKDQKQQVLVESFRKDRYYIIIDNSFQIQLSHTSKNYTYNSSFFERSEFDIRRDFIDFLFVYYHWVLDLDKIMKMEEKVKKYLK